jgi:hypothetical protein
MKLNKKILIEKEKTKKNTTKQSTIPINSALRGGIQ